MSVNVLYSTTATVTGGRAGHARSADGVLDLDLTVPKELGGDGKRGTNPEQMFAAGYAACFQSAMRHVAASKKQNITDSSGFGLKVDMDGTVKGISKAEVEELVKFVHSTVCPYSNAVRGNVDVNIRVL